MARIEVRFLIDANGILNVTARDVRTGKEQSVEVKPSYGLDRRAGGSHDPGVLREGRRDFKERQVREARVEADAILAATEKAKPNDAWFELTDEEREAIDNASMSCWWSIIRRPHLIPRKIEELNDATMKLAENMMNTAVRGALKGTSLPGAEMAGATPSFNLVFNSGRYCEWKLMNIWNVICSNPVHGSSQVDHRIEVF